jgi:hypothetical protein
MQAKELRHGAFIRGVVMEKDWGYRLLGLCALLFGVTALAWHQLMPWEQSSVLRGGPSYQLVLYLTAVIFIIGGAAVNARRTMRAAAALIGGAVGFFALIQVWEAAAHPAANGWINLSETLGTFCGAAILFARAGKRPEQWLVQGATILFGVCVALYALAQIVYFHYTATLVPRWIPPSQTFWAGLTTIAFALAAAAIVTGWYRRIAVELLVVMLAIFGVTIWMPAVVAHPSNLGDWSELGVTFGICSGAWILADRLRSRALAGAPAASRA